MAWYNKYRPQDFDSVIGQELIKTVLKNTIVSGKIKHAYLFNGPKGTGKTTLARIFANNLNDTKTNPEAKFDIIEMDAASNTGIDDIRSLIDSAQNPPLSGKYKVYIIDEIHMLSKNAMNALLKILEEPPVYLIFLLATTNPEKLIPTILSRVTKLNLTSHTNQDIVKNLLQIAKLENINIDNESLELIARQAEGGQRDAINLLETISSYNLKKYTKENVSHFLGIAQNDLIIKILNDVVEEKTDIINELETCGIEGKNLLNQVLTFLLNESMYNDSLQYDELVIPLSELISLNLPITDAVSAFALFQSKLRSSGIIISKKNFKKDVKTKVEEIKEVNSVIQEEGVKIIPSNNLTSEKEIKEEAQQINVQNPPSSHVSASVKEISSLIKEFAKKSVFTLKLIGLDMKVEAIEDNKILVSVSNNVYLAQIKSQKNKSAFEEHINNETGGQYLIEPSKRSNNTKLEVSTSYDETKVENVNFIGGTTTEKDIEKIKEKVSVEEPIEKVSKEKQSTEIEASDIFYKSYKKLAPNMEGKGVEIYQDDIIEPQKNVQIEEKPPEKSDWDKHLDGFDFE